VEHGSTSCSDDRLSSRAASAHTRSLSATPPGAHTLLILLFTTTAWMVGELARRCRPTSTGAPGNALLVNMAA
jgi:hypothetical protein